MRSCLAGGGSGRESVWDGDLVADLWTLTVFWLGQVGFSVLDPQKVHRGQQQPMIEIRIPKRQILTLMYWMHEREALPNSQPPKAHGGFGVPEASQCTWTGMTLRCRSTSWCWPSPGAGRGHDS